MPQSDWSQDEIAFFQTLPAFSDLPDSLQEEAWSSLAKISADPGEKVIEQHSTENPALYIVVSGGVRLMDVILHRGRADGPPGLIFGVQMARDNDPAPYEVVAALDTTLARLPREAFLSICQQAPAFAEAFAGEFEPLPVLPQAGGWVGGAAASPFAYIQSHHGSKPWGSVLDAGTGESSLRWILNLPTTQWTAVSGAEGWKTSLHAAFGEQLREQDRILVDNWTNSSFLEGEVFDVVLADYLLGAIERFAPYFQSQLWKRLKPHVGGHLYVVGQEPPHLQEPKTVGGQLAQRVNRLRDICMTLAGQTPFREYPMEWVCRSLTEAGFVVEATHTFPLKLGAQYLDSMLDVSLRLLPEIPGDFLRKGLSEEIVQMRQEALSLSETFWGIQFGTDYVVVARPRD
ncbi:MAG: cyclic nucleotide-binding domain-containing protein [Deltaproteobacteria bacterium]|nr:MAG: cyclic nucleotide-binding domain-containing protein [Deltaproteobacteria bacterium]